MRSFVRETIAVAAHDAFSWTEGDQFLGANAKNAGMKFRCVSLCQLCEHFRRWGFTVMQVFMRNRCVGPTFVLHMHAPLITYAVQSRLVDSRRLRRAFVISTSWATMLTKLQ